MGAELQAEAKAYLAQKLGGTARILPAEAPYRGAKGVAPAPELVILVSHLEGGRREVSVILEEFLPIPRNGALVRTRTWEHNFASPYSMMPRARAFDDDEVKRLMREALFAFAQDLKLDARAK